jgi:hypothetical protein
MLTVARHARVVTKIVGGCWDTLHPVESGTAAVGEWRDSNPDIRDSFRLGHLHVAGSGLEHASLRRVNGA